MPLRAINRCAVCALCLLLPVLLGGCPEFRNSVVDAADAVTRDFLFQRQDPQMAFSAAADSIANAALDLFFGHFRTDSVSRR